jgi:hypothetical protein
MRTFVLISAAVLLAAAARGDVVYLKNGKSIEGKVTVKGEKVVVEIAHGTVSFPKSKVLRIERKASPVEVYEKKLAAIPAKDINGRLGLARWCRRQGLNNRARELFEQVLDADTDNAEARKQLGYVQHKGKWMTPEEKYRSEGLVEFEGKWHKPESVTAIKKARAEAKQAEEERKKADLELKIKIAEVEKLQIERQRLETERRRLEDERTRLEAERLRLERVFVRYPHFKVIGNHMYYYPDYPVCRKGIIIIRVKKKSSKDDDKDDKKDK